jgi:hypothetical protein
MIGYPNAGPRAGKYAYIVPGFVEEWKKKDGISERGAARTSLHG